MPDCRALQVLKRIYTISFQRKMQLEFELVAGDSIITTFDQLKEVVHLTGHERPDNIRGYLKAAMLEGSVTACDLMIHYMWQTTVDKEDYVNDMFFLIYSVAERGLLTSVIYLVATSRFTLLNCRGLLARAYLKKDLMAACTLYKSFSKEIKTQLPEDDRLRECLKWINTAPRSGVQL